LTTSHPTHPGPFEDAHLASENPSATHLAALAFNDLLYLALNVPYTFVCYEDDYDWLCTNYVVNSVMWSTVSLEPLLVLNFSVVRLLAIRRPLQVCCIVTC